LFKLKKKAKNKAHIKVSINNAYIVKEISIFVSYYFEPHVRTIINRIPRHDDGGGVPFRGNLPIFSYYRRPLLKNIVLRRHMIDIKFKQVDNYMLFNHDE
jgi:hypothetical protein